MSAKTNFLVLLGALMGLAACQKSAQQSHSEVWQRGQGTAPELFASAQFSTEERSVPVLDESVHFSYQKVGPAFVEGGSLQTIRDKKNELVFGRSSYLIAPAQVQNIDPVKLQQLYTDRFMFLERFKLLNQNVRHARILSDPQLVLQVVGQNKTRPSYVFDLLEPKQMMAKRYWVLPNFHIAKKETISTEFDAPAWIYSVDENHQIQQELLKHLLDDPAGPKSTYLEVTSNAGTTVSNQDGPWRFSTDDPRFDQVQAYFFVQQGIDFFAKELGFKLPVAVQVETAEGYPDKTSAAFTYNNQIRLGAGDGVTYGSMAQDPSIVIHETGHVLVGVIAHLPTQGPGGSLNEAFADYFAASCLGNPKMGQIAYLPGPYKRSLEDLILYTQKNGGLYHDSQIVSGTLWEIREQLGAPIANKLAFKTLARLGAAQSLTDFSQALKMASGEMLSAQEQQTVLEVLQKHQWP